MIEGQLRIGPSMRCEWETVWQIKAISISGTTPKLNLVVNN